ncbi:MAG: YlxR family protein [Actinomycetota bacterium]|nr:YlxR family protein [Actinomycetota bacterium]
MAGPNGSLLTGRTLPGRGAWLCRGSESCLDAAIRRRAFPKALRTVVAVEALTGLRERLAERGRIEEALPQTTRSVREGLK